MTTKKINSDSFTEVSTRVVRGFVYVDGTVELTIRGETKVVPATKIFDGTIIARGIVGRYNTSDKEWPATIQEKKTENGIIEVVNFGRDDRHSKFKKQDCIYFI